MCDISDRSTDRTSLHCICSTHIDSSSFPQTFVRSHKVGPFTNFSPRTAYNYISGKLKFHDRRTRPPIKEPMLGARILRRSRPGTCVISRLAWYSVGVQHALHERRHASGYERLRLPTVSPRYFSFFLLSRCLRIFSLSLSLSLSLSFSRSLCFLTVGLTDRLNASLALLSPESVSRRLAQSTESLAVDITHDTGC